jgi:hypothetical protein
MSSQDKTPESPSEHKEGEVLPPQAEDSGNSGTPPTVFAEIAAQITQYTERPDLLLETLEKHSPGFIQDMVERARRLSDREAEGRFYFGKHQAYAGVTVAVVAAFSILGAVVYSVVTGKTGFWTIIALGIFYAITQGGLAGFSKIADAVGRLIEKFKHDGPKN